MDLVGATSQWWSRRTQLLRIVGVRLQTQRQREIRLAWLQTRLRLQIFKRQRWLAQHGTAIPTIWRWRLHGPDGPGFARLDVAQDGSPQARTGTERRDALFHETKLLTAKFYAQRELPLSTALRRKVEAGAETLMRIPVEAF
jgi:hypothetical protein